MARYARLGLDREYPFGRDAPFQPLGEAGLGDAEAVGEFLLGARYGDGAP